MLEVNNTSEETQDTDCDGQSCFEVLVRKYHHKTEVRYWCNRLRCYFDPHSVDCPRKHDQPVKRKGFNKWGL